MAVVVDVVGEVQVWGYRLFWCDVAGCAFVGDNCVFEGWTDGRGVGICGEDEFFGGDAAIGGV